MKNATDLTIILDRSGSMGSVKKGVIDGLNDLITKQKDVEEECRLTLVQFDGEAPYEVLRSNELIKQVSLVNHDEYQPRGNTPLYDAVGKGINEVGKKLASLLEVDKPDKVVFVIVTDGYENASREFKQAQVFDMIKHQREEYNWEFVFIGANQDALASGKGISIPSSHSINYVSTPEGTQSMFGSLDRKLRSYRKQTVSSMAWDEKDRKEQEVKATS